MEELFHDTTSLALPFQSISSRKPCRNSYHGREEQGITGAAGLLSPEATTPAEVFTLQALAAWPSTGHIVSLSLFPIQELVRLRWVPSRVLPNSKR